VAPSLGAGRSPERSSGSEGHGREEFLSGVDLSRTVGWFTSLFPVRLDIGVLEEGWARGSALGRILKRIKEQLRQLPDNGVGYGVLRYLNAEAGEVLSRLPKRRSVSTIWAGSLRWGDGVGSCSRELEF